MVIAGIVAVLVTIVVAAIFKLQTWAAFPAPPPSAQRPDAVTLVGGEKLWLDAAGDRVEAWFLPARQAAAAPLVIHTHGNGELIDHWAERVGPLREAGFGVLLVEYPGYGRSGGKPSDRSITATMLAAHDWALRDPRVDPHRIVVHGRSMGGGAAGQLAGRRPLAGVILESSFTSLADLIRAQGVPDFLVTTHLDTLEALSGYSGPLLILHGGRDEVIPVSHARALAATFPRARLVIQDCGHNDCPPQWELVLSFLRENGVSSEPATGDSP